jgi:hypothetical protein
MLRPDLRRAQDISAPRKEVLATAHAEPSRKLPVTSSRHSQRRQDDAAQSYSYDRSGRRVAALVNDIQVNVDAVLMREDGSNLGHSALKILFMCY